MALAWGDFDWSIKRWFSTRSVSALGVTGNLTVGGAVSFTDVPEYANNAAAVSAGKAVGFVYRTGDAMKVVH